jgi:uncharacterized protein (TIGR02594 family)
MIKSPYELAEKFLGVKEIAGNIDNPIIMSMLKLDNDWVEHDETPWCAGFVNYVLYLCGVERSKSLRARSYLKIGKSIPLGIAEKGFDIVVFQRGSGRQPDKTVIKAPGHVAFFDNWEGGDYITVLGGNQGNEVSIKKYSRKRILDIKRVKSLEV